MKPSPEQYGRIDIAMGYDAGYAPHAAAVLASVVAYAPGQRFRFIILYCDMDDKLRKRVESVAPDQEWVWIEVREEDLPEFVSRDYFNRTTLFRLGLERLAPADCERVLYLDADIALLRDVRELWTADLKGQPLGAVPDAYIDPEEWRQGRGLEPGGDYLNAGVLLVDLAMVREEKLFSKSIDYLATHQKECYFYDQDAMNYAFWKHWTPLEAIWNVQRHMSQPEIVHEIPEHRRLNGRMPALIHYLGKDKPWQPHAWHPWAWAYWRGLRRTDFVKDVARSNGLGPLARFRLWLRWLRRSPARIVSRL